MFSLKCILLVTSCLVLTATASPIEFVDFYEIQPQDAVNYEYEPVLSRQVRSPQHGSIELGARKDQYGREASLNYNHNLYTSNDGRGSIDAYAQASRNFDYNRNDFGGGIQYHKMFSVKFTLLLISCLMLTVIASPVWEFEAYEHKNINDRFKGRQLRSTEHGNLDVAITKDQFGDQASINYKQQIGPGSIQAFAEASHNPNDGHTDLNGVAACLILTVSASPIELEELYEPHQAQLEEYEYEPVLVRNVRSPQHGNIDFGLKQDQFGREASVNYNHNLFTSSDGRGSIDAYAQASRNFDYNSNNFGGGIRGSWSF
ncbi:hypothetical protein FF38_08822 [Lucilia cuprina]|uniref:Attacin C-terminal domain-containing protein n=1 Tax=Lucilia cuprina TaxID=7375 RepID=A0A0L0BQV8_LUCCU|nr:hypothetical protein FF38_08822 [Lucilia cuprina]